MASIFPRHEHSPDDETHFNIDASLKTQLSRSSAFCFNWLPVLLVLRAPFSMTVSLPMGMNLIVGRALGLQQSAGKIAGVLSFMIGPHPGDVARAKSPDAWSMLKYLDQSAHVILVRGTYVGDLIFGHMSARGVPCQVNSG